MHVFAISGDLSCPSTSVVYRKYSPAPWKEVGPFAWPHDGKFNNISSSQKGNPAFWKKVLKEASAMHFFSSSTKEFRVSGYPKRDLYSHLGQKYCPEVFKLL